MFSFVLSVVLTSLVVLGPCFFVLAYVTWKNPHPTGKRIAFYHGLVGLVFFLVGLIYLLY